MTSPPRTDPAKLAAARELAAARRKKVLDRVASGDLTVADVIAIAGRELEAGGPTYVGNLPVATVLAAVPGFGPAAVARALDAAGTTSRRRVKGLVTLAGQRDRLLVHLTPRVKVRARPYPGWPYHHPEDTEIR